MFVEEAPVPMVSAFRFVTVPALIWRVLPAAAPLPTVREKLLLTVGKGLVPRLRTAFEFTVTTTLEAPLPIVILPELVAAESILFVPLFMFQLPLILKVVLEASRKLAAVVLLEVVRVPPLNLKREAVVLDELPLVTSRSPTVMEPVPARVKVPVPTVRVAEPELITPPLVTTSVLLVTEVLPE